VPQKVIQTGSIFSGINFRTSVETVQGATSTAERNAADSYTVEVKVKVNVPKPHRELADLEKLNPGLGKILPWLPASLATAKISPEFDAFYRGKIASLRANLNRLDQLISRHNFYDCETILELQSPATKRRALLIQADMDVDTDGSDGDRAAALESGGSASFQPFTSYRWPRRTQNPNPSAAIWEKRIAETQTRITDPKTPAADLPKLKADLARLRIELRDLQTYSFLTGALDPFIVLPGGMLGRSGIGAAFGDYCIVIVDDVLYPAIVGDAGPMTKVGEASLRLCRQVAPRANGTTRALSDLKATYIVFPGTAEKPFGPPDYEKWRDRCTALLAEFGGSPAELFTWTDLSKPPVPPVPPAPTTPAPAPPGAPAAPPATSAVTPAAAVLPAKAKP
jgi:hypothetical protein